MHPDITMAVIALGSSMSAWERNDLASIREKLAETVRRLATGGCDFFVCPDNPAHIALETPGAPLALPGLHIAEVVADEAASKGYKTIGLLGTRWTMDGPVYADAFRRHALALRVPPPDDRALVNRIIFDELVNGVFTEGSRSEFVRIISALKNEGCDAVVLGCTEIPLLVSPDASPLPTLDSTRLLAKAAVDVAIGSRAEPAWRGGPMDAVDDVALMDTSRGTHQGFGF